MSALYSFFCSFLFTFLEVGAKGDSAGSQILPMYTEIRKILISNLSAYTSLATGTACLILVFHLVVVAYKGMSDEQSAGLGGIKMIELIRPVILVFAIQSSPVIVSSLDSIMNHFSQAIAGQIDEKSIDGLFEQYLTASDIAAEAADPVYIAALKDLAGSDKNFKVKKGNDEIYNYVREKYGVTKAETKELRHYLRPYLRQYFRNEERSRTMKPDEATGTIKGAGVVAQFVSWCYNMAYKVMLVFAEIFLCVIATVFPWVLVISIFERWKNAWVGWTSRYVQVSFWKVTGAVINFCVYFTLKASQDGFAKENLDRVREAVESFGDGVEFASAAEVVSMQNHVFAIDWGAITSSFGLRTIICLAGLIAMMKISSITETIIPQMEGGSAGGGAGDIAGGAGAILQKGAGMAGGTVKTAGKVTVGGAAGAVTGGIAGGIAGGAKGALKGIGQTLIGHK